MESNNTNNNNKRRALSEPIEFNPAVLEVITVATKLLQTCESQWILDDSEIENSGLTPVMIENTMNALESAAKSFCQQYEAKVMREREIGVVMKQAGIHGGAAYWFFKCLLKLLSHDIIASFEIELTHKGGSIGSMTALKTDDRKEFALTIRETNGSYLRDHLENLFPGENLVDSNKKKVSSATLLTLFTKTYTKINPHKPFIIIRFIDHDDPRPVLLQKISKVVYMDCFAYDVVPINWITKIQIDHKIFDYFYKESENQEEFTTSE